MKRFVGHHGGVPVYEDPDCPPGMMYFMDDDMTVPVYAVKNIKTSLWQRLRYKLRHLLRANI